MGWGSLLVSFAVLIGLMAYVGYPLLRTSSDPKRVVEAWVAQVRSERHGSVHAVPEVRLPVVDTAEVADDVINFCPGCGRRVEPDHVYCPKCGRRLTKGQAP